MRFGVKAADMVVGVVTVALAAYVLFESSDLGFYADGVPGPGFFPIVLGIALLISGLLLIASRVLNIAVPEDEDRDPEQIAPRSLMVWLTLMLSAALIPIIGFVATMVLLVAALLFGFERRRSIGAVVAVLLIPGLAYWLFAGVLGVLLPTGPWGD
jgi:putative tricarboxylic transport membrane protein